MSSGKTPNPNEIEDKMKWAKQTQNLGNIKDLPLGFYRTEGSNRAR